VPSRGEIDHRRDFLDSGERVGTVSKQQHPYRRRIAPKNGRRQLRDARGNGREAKKVVELSRKPPCGARLPA